MTNAQVAEYVVERIEAALAAQPPAWRARLEAALADGGAIAVAPLEDGVLLVTVAGLPLVEVRLADLARRSAN